MSETKSNASKIEEGRGKGSGASYKPWIQTREISSCGTCSNPKDWKTGREVVAIITGSPTRKKRRPSSKAPASKNICDYISDA